MNIVKFYDITFDREFEIDLKNYSSEELNEAQENE